MPLRFLIPVLRRGAAARRAGVSVIITFLALSGGCDRIESALKNEAGNGGGDPVWRADSSMLASKPGILFRVFDHEQGQAVAPIATIGAIGFRPLTLGSRGWRSFDVDYLRDGNRLIAIRDGRAAGAVLLTRGMWESSGPLDSIPRCNLVPAGLATAPPATALALAGARPALRPVTPLSSGELQEAIATIPTLIAPSSGISTSQLSRYSREVRVLMTGSSSRPSILVIYNDPVPVSDTLQPTAQRPRQFVVILDKGIYGYRPTYTFTTLGNARTLPRITFLDYVDVDGDGKAEVFFGFRYRHVDRQLDATTAIRFENDAWREVFKASVRCP